MRPLSSLTPRIVCPKRSARTTLTALLAALSVGVSPAVQAETTPDMDGAAALNRTLDAILHDDAASPDALHRACSAWVSPRIHAADPLLAARLKLCQGRVAQAQKRQDAAKRKYEEAVRAATKVDRGARARRIEAEAEYRMAEMAERDQKDVPRCGHELGLDRVMRAEDQHVQRALERVEAQYRAVMDVGDPVWTRRAAYRVTTAYEDVWRTRLAAAPSGFRGVDVPSPFDLAAIDAAAVLGPVVAPPGGIVPATLMRAYRALARDAERGPADPALTAELVRRATALETDAHATPKNTPPAAWSGATDGAVALRGGVPVLRKAGAWVKVSRASAVAAARQRLKTADAAFGLALGVLADLGEETPSSAVQAGFESEDTLARLGALRAIERVPDSSWTEPLIARLEVLLAAPENNRAALFSTLERARYGEAERTLLALRAIVQARHDAAAPLFRDKRLPSAERAWLLAELNDTHFTYQHENLARQRDPATAAGGLYGIVLANGSKVAWIVHQHLRDPRPLVRCTATHLLGMVGGARSAEPAQ